jgi:hypothetical protein
MRVQVSAGKLETLGWDAKPQIPRRTEQFAEKLEKQIPRG